MQNSHLRLLHAVLFAFRGKHSIILQFYTIDKLWLELLRHYFACLIACGLGTHRSTSIA